MKKGLFVTVCLSMFFALVSCGECKHVWDEGTITKQATEETAGEKTFKCEKCEETRVEEVAKLEHTHKFEAGWSSDATHHWHNASCDHKDQVSEKGEHTWDEGKVSKEATYKEEGKKVYTCTVCNHSKSETIPVVEHEHVASTQWSSDKDNHWNTCTLCGDIMNKVAHSGGQATCQEKAECEVCSTLYGDKVAHNMSATEYVSDAQGHWHECSYEGCNQKSDIVGHVYDQEISTNLYKKSDADCITPETYYKSCVCGKVGESTFTVGEPLGHIGGHATCIELAECERCHFEYGTYADHNYGKLVEKVEPTCTETGMKAYYKCSDCLKYFLENKTEATLADLVIPAKGHYMMPYSDGTHHWQECDREGCDHKTALENHVFDQQVVAEKYFVSAATCEEAAKYKKSCICGQEGTETFDNGQSLGHVGGEASCTQLKECERCHESYGELVSHDYGTMVERVEPTCTETGMKAYYKCSVCLGYFTENKLPTTYNDLVIEAKGHYMMPYSDGTHHWQECDREGCDHKTEGQYHEWDFEDAKIEVKPTASVPGKILISCLTEKCEEQHEVVLPVYNSDNYVTSLVEESGKLSYKVTLTADAIEEIVATDEVLDDAALTAALQAHKTTLAVENNNGYTITVNGEIYTEAYTVNKPSTDPNNNNADIIVDLRKGQEVKFYQNGNLITFTDHNGVIFKGTTYTVPISGTYTFYLSKNGGMYGDPKPVTYTSYEFKVNDVVYEANEVTTPVKGYAVTLQANNVLKVSGTFAKGTDELYSYTCATAGNYVVVINSNGAVSIVEAEAKLQELTLYYYNSNSWENVALWAWTETDNLTGGTWPGAVMQAVEGQDGWYSITLESLSFDGVNLIFNNNNNGSQTATIVLDPSKPYYYGNSSAAYSSFAEAIEKESTKVESNVYLAGSMNGWSTTANVLYVTSNSDIVELEINLSAGNYEFKFVVSGSWKGNGGEINDTTEPNWWDLTSGSNVRLKATGGTYVFQYRLSDGFFYVYKKVPENHVLICRN